MVAFVDTISRRANLSCASDGICQGAENMMVGVDMSSRVHTIIIKHLFPSFD